MSEKEKKIAKALGKALNDIPESKREYFLGFSEGVASAKQKILEDMKEAAETPPDEEK